MLDIVKSRGKSVLRRGRPKIKPRVGDEEQDGREGRVSLGQYMVEGVSGEGEVITCDCRHLGSTEARVTEFDQAGNVDGQAQLIGHGFVTMRKVRRKQTRHLHSPAVDPVAPPVHLRTECRVGQPGRSREPRHVGFLGELRSSSHQLPCEWPPEPSVLPQTRSCSSGGIQPLRAETPLAQVAGLVNFGRREPISAGRISGRCSFCGGKAPEQTNCRRGSNAGSAGVACRCG